MLKILPDALQRLERRLTDGPVEQRVKAMQIVQELGWLSNSRPRCCPLRATPTRASDRRPLWLSETS